MTASRKRLLRAAAASAVAVPLGVIAANSAFALDLPSLPGTDTTPVGNVLAVSPTGVLGTAASTLQNPTSAVGTVTGAATNTPAGGLVGTVTGAAANPTGIASNPTGVAGRLVSQTPAGGLVSQTPAGSLTRQLPAVPDPGNAVSTVKHATDDPTGNLGLGGVVNSLGLGDTVHGVTGTVGGLINPILGGDLLGGLLGDKKGNHEKDARDNGELAVNHEGDSSELPHTGGNGDMTALLLCAGIGLAGAGTTLIARRRGGIGA